MRSDPYLPRRPGRLGGEGRAGVWRPARSRGRVGRARRRVPPLRATVAGDQGPSGGARATCRSPDARPTCAGVSAATAAASAGGRSPRPTRSCPRGSASRSASARISSSAYAAARRTPRSPARSARPGQVARAFGLGARDELAARGAARPPRRLSLDEAQHRRRRELVTVVSDLEGKRVVEVLEGRSRRVVERYLRTLPEEHRRAIEVVSIDPYEAYRQAIHDAPPGARIVVDHFHLVRGANTALDSVRRERQRVASKRRLKGRAPLGARPALAPGPSTACATCRSRRTSASQSANWRRLCAPFEAEPVIAEAWGLKKGFRAIYRAADRRQAERRLELVFHRRRQPGWRG
jgi:hypothetical protein